MLHSVKNFLAMVYFFGYMLNTEAVRDASVDATKRVMTTKADGIKEVIISKMNDFHNFVESEMDLLKYKIKDTAPRECPAGWKRIGNSCINIVRDQHTDYTWLRALKTCALMNAELMEIETEAEHAYLKQSAKDNNRHLWLGATDFFKEGDWVWLSGKPFPNQDFLKWGKGQPDGGTSQNCLGIYTVDIEHIHDFPCGGSTYKNLPVCKIKLN